jgi:hypothetical protein
MSVTALILPVSGSYVGTWQGLYLGMMNDNGFEVTLAMKSQEINESDAFGMTLLDYVYRGMDWRIRFTGKEWSRVGTGGLLNALQPFGSSMSGQLGPVVSRLGGTFPPLPNNPPVAGIYVGNLASGVAQILVLNSVMGNAPAPPSGGPVVPTTLTANGAVLSPNTQSQFQMTSKLRELQIEMCLLPYQYTLSVTGYNVPNGTVVAVPFSVT